MRAKCCFSLRLVAASPAAAATSKFLANIPITAVLIAPIPGWSAALRQSGKHRWSHTLPSVQQTRLSSIGATPAGQPQNYYGPLAQGTQTAAYGIIASGPYIGTTFTATGQAEAFNYAGNCYTSGGALHGNIGADCFGTPSNPGDQGDTHEFTQGLYDPLTRGDIYSRVSYDLSPNTEVYATLNYGISRTQNTPAQGNSSKSGITVRCDNAYLLESGLFPSAAACASAVNGNAAAAQTAATESAATMGFGSDWANIPTDQLMFLTRTMRRYVVGGDGSFDLFGKSWSWESYFQHGETDTSIKIYNMPLSGAPLVGASGTSAGATNGQFSRFNLAQDAVFNSAGQVVCRNTIAQAYGCVPFNPFGGTTVTPGQLAYFDGQNGPGGTTIGPDAIHDPASGSLQLRGQWFADRRLGGSGLGGSGLRIS